MAKRILIKKSSARAFLENIYRSRGTLPPLKPRVSRQKREKIHDFQAECRKLKELFFDSQYWLDIVELLGELKKSYVTVHFSVPTEPNMTYFFKLYKDGSLMRVARKSRSRFPREDIWASEIAIKAIIQVFKTHRAFLDRIDAWVAQEEKWFWGGGYG